MAEDLNTIFAEAKTKAENASNIAFQWANGDINTSIQTESGELPSLAKFQFDNVGADSFSEFEIGLSLGNVSITAQELQDNTYFYTVGNSVARTVFIPATPRVFYVENRGSSPVTLSRDSVEHVLPSGLTFILYTDGTTQGLYNITSQAVKKVSVASAPTVNDDETEGFSVNSTWINTSGAIHEIYVCTDASTGSAHWVLISFTPDELGTISTQDADNVAITGGTISGITDLAVTDGGTGASSASDARTNLGLGTSSVEDTGVLVGNVVQLEDVGGNAGLPSVDGSQLIGVATTAATLPIDNTDLNSTAINAQQLAEGALVGRKNFIINGVAPFVNQEGNKTDIADGEHIADIVGYESNNNAVVNAAITTISGKEWIEFDVVLADTSISSAQYAGVRFSVEGYDTSPLNLGLPSARTITLSFKHRHTETGTYCVSIRNAARDRCYVFEYTQTASDVEETHSETINLDTTGTWLVDNSLGMGITFTMAAGTSFHTTADAWVSADRIATGNQVNSLGSQVNFFRIRDVQLEIGSVATEPEYIPYSEKLSLVQRYYQEAPFSWKFDDNGSTGASYGTDVNFLSRMRTTPTSLGSNVADSTGVTPTNVLIHDSKIASMIFQLSSTGIVSRTYWGNLKLDARL